ncbi:multidrug transporter [Bacillus sp. FJAT-27231]|uniref:DMT family transporter n=1 Tax=Bacillus sp. FJAT-27231 TaxID=1679168 RepID=UPI0006712656|nr:EamA family transporter [Bacillus sp. FJAT-27231]KMY54031.1 multidrug transporter [Bacillus sp. FJAT-27231]
MLRLKGIMMIVIGSILWGVTGVIVEWLLVNTHLSTSFLLTIRLAFAGIFLLVFLLISKKDIMSVWKTPSWRYQLIIFSIVGMLGIQYTFVAAIEESNAVFATLLQFSAPIFVTLYVSLKNKKLPPRYQMVGIAGTLVGLYLLMTNGSLGNLLVSPVAIFWGVGLGLTYAFYILYPARLMAEWSILMIVGWAMLIGGVVLGVISGAWKPDEWLLLTQDHAALMISVLITLGTIAYVLFLTSMKYISAVEASILSSLEPLSVMLISAIWLGTVLQSFQLIGVLLMILFVTWLSIGGRKINLGRKNQRA